MEFTRRSFGLAAASTALLPVLPAAAKEAPAGAQAPQGRRPGEGLNISALKDMSIQRLTHIAKDLTVTGAMLRASSFMYLRQ